MYIEHLSITCLLRDDRVIRLSKRAAACIYFSVSFNNPEV